MEPAEVETLIEEEIPDARATVTRPRAAAMEDEDAHYSAVVVSPAFEGLPLVQQHEMVYDALGDRMTRDVHAMEIRTYTPEEYDG